jgi:hypothetical protein
MDLLLSNPMPVAAFLCGAVAIYLVIRRTQKRRND